MCFDFYLILFFSDFIYLFVKLGRQAPRASRPAAVSSLTAIGKNTHSHRHLAGERERVCV